MHNIKSFEPVILEKLWGREIILSGSLVPSSPELSIFCKIIEAKDNLSVQVHPIEKTEAWYILEAEQGAGIYLGFKDGVNKAILKSALLNSENVSELLNWIPVKKGNIFYVPSGTVHSIGKGITLFEVQQNADITYRVYDFNRTDSDGKKRTLHINEALSSINFSKEINAVKVFATKLKSEFFQIDSVILEAGETKQFYNKSNTYQLLFTIDSDIKINDSPVNKYKLYFIPVSREPYTIKNLSGDIGTVLSVL